MVNDEIRYETNGLKSPGFNSIQRKLLYLKKMPIIREFSFIKRLMYGIYKFPWTTSNVGILGGVRRGNNIIIRAVSVVIKDIPSGVFAA